MIRELIKIAIIVSIGYLFLSTLPKFITSIEMKLNKYFEKPQSRTKGILLSFLVAIIALIYILLVYLAIPLRGHYRLIALSASLLFTMVRFVQDDYNAIGKTQLFNIFNFILACSISIEALIMMIFP